MKLTVVMVDLEVQMSKLYSFIPNEHAISEKLRLDIEKKALDRQIKHHSTIIKRLIKQLAEDLARKIDKDALKQVNNS